jgi:hypothetical protein
MTAVRMTPGGGCVGKDRLVLTGAATALAVVTIANGFERLNFTRTAAFVPFVMYLLRGNELVPRTITTLVLAFSESFGFLLNDVGTGVLTRGLMSVANTTFGLVFAFGEISIVGRTVRDLIGAAFGRPITSRGAGGITGGFSISRGCAGVTTGLNPAVGDGLGIVETMTGLIGGGAGSLDCPTTGRPSGPGGNLKGSFAACTADATKLP